MTVTLTQVANAGVAISQGDGLWLVDALHRGSKPYEGAGEESLQVLRRLAAKAAGPIRLLLTHLHEDHASPEEIAAFAREYPLEVYTADPAIGAWSIGPAKAFLLTQGQLAQVGAARVLALPMPHLSPERFQLNHCALRVELGGIGLFFSADSNLDESAYEAQAAHILGVDAAVCVYAYGFTRRNLAFTKKHIDPGLLVVNHFPPPGVDSFHSGEAFARFLSKEEPPMPVRALLRPGDRVEIGGQHVGL